MSWRDWFGGTSRRTTARISTVQPYLLIGEELVPAVGESFYQPALLRCCGARHGEAVRFSAQACLVAQPENPHDRNAVAIEISGELVGHLARTDAPHWQQLLIALTAKGYVATCEAMIAGRGEEGETENLGVFLHLPTPREAEAQLASLIG
jgi:hypothetical protein